MDNECKLGVYQIDFTTGESPAAVQEAKVEEDDLALSNIDMADLEDQLEATQDKAEIVPKASEIVQPEPVAEAPIRSQASVVQSEKRVRYAQSSKEIVYQEARPVHNMGKALDDIV